MIAKAGDWVKYLLNFLRRPTPKAGKELPEYYRKALVVNEAILVLYFLLCFFLFPLVFHIWEWIPLAFCAGILICMSTNGRIHVRASLYAYGLLVMLWCAWQSSAIGWGCGAQHLLMPVLMLCFFHLYEPPVAKVIDFVVLVAYRMALFAYTLGHPALYTLDQATSIVLQTVNSLTIFVMLAIDCALFSSSIQDTERQLRLDNQELHKEAGTDPLTQLPNRRAMLDEMMLFHRDFPDTQFCIAIGDIDFFKNVNDSYGHACGDYTLQTLSALFREKAEGKYKVCRWGGEEFCFFLPNRNLDEAGGEMLALVSAVRQMALRYGKIDFSITITIGVAENDFCSPMEAILEEADRKLYQGKMQGRDRVVI